MNIAHLPPDQRRERFEEGIAEKLRLYDARRASRPISAEDLKVLKQAARIAGAIAARLATDSDEEIEWSLVKDILNQAPYKPIRFVR